MTALPFELPPGFTPLVDKGATVTIGQVIAQKEVPKNEIINIIEVLNLSRKDARNALRKGPGDMMAPGEIIAVKKDFFGKVKKSITSSISGMIIRYERDTGNLVVRSDATLSSLEIISPVAGTVTLCNNREIVIQTSDALVSQGVSLGTSGEGELFVLQESFDDNSSDNALYYLDSKAAEKIVLMHTITRDIVIKGSSIGVAGFLGLEIPNEEIVYLQKKGNTVPVLEITQDFIPKLASWERRKVMIEIGSKAIILRD
jgi:hypothetical protein